MTATPSQRLTEPDFDRLDLRLLEIFCRVCEEKSFSRAAERLGLSQPTVSSHIKSLERQAGASLIDRSGREATLTPLGALVYEHGRRIVAAKRALLEEIDRALSRFEGRLRIGASTTPGEHLLPPLIHGFRAAFPEVEISLRVRDSADILEGVEHGGIEMGFVGVQPPGETALRFEDFASDRLVLVAPAGPPWEGVAEVTLERLCREPLVVREPSSGTRRMFERRLAELGRGLWDLNVVAEMGSTSAVKQAVLSGLGVAVVSSLAIRQEVEGGRLKVLPVPEIDPLERRFFAVTHCDRPQSPLCQAFRQWLAGRELSAYY